MTSSNFSVVRTRVAPSPTGDPHIGTAYIALFNWVLARQHGGQFIVRIEDTDQARYRADSEAQILDSLRWLGLDWDEGPDKPGTYGPYRQSERLPRYQEVADKLRQDGHAYACFCTPERLDTVRKEQMARKESVIGYDRHCRDLCSDEQTRRIAGGEPHVIRMKAPVDGQVTVRDELRGNIDFEAKAIDDQVIIKSDRFPTYHLAVVVDDHDMQISHVLRGEEWISSFPKQVILYDMLHWPKPKFYHMPLLRNADKSKISKRKNPTSINYYRRKGILPQVLVNYLTLMAWNPGNDQEIFTREEMLEKFVPEKMHVGGPVFDLKKLQWLNGVALRALSDDTYLHTLRERVFSDDTLRRIIPLVKERVDAFEDFVPYAGFFFSGDLNYDKDLLIPKKGTPEMARTVLADLMERMENLTEWTHQQIQAAFEAYNEEKGLKPKDTYMPIRVAVTGRKETPPLFETIEVLGKEIVRVRIRAAITALSI